MHRVSGMNSSLVFHHPSRGVMTVVTGKFVVRSTNPDEVGHCGTMYVLALGDPPLVAHMTAVSHNCVTTLEQNKVLLIVIPFSFNKNPVGICLELTTATLLRYNC